MVNFGVRNFGGRVTIILLILLVLLLFDLVVGDENLFLMINHGVANPIVDMVCLYVLVPLFSLLLFIPLLFLLKRNYRELSLISLASGSLSYFIGSLIKLLVGRPRPFEVLPARLVGPWTTTTSSFPSTTTALAFGLAIPFVLKNKGYGILLLILASLVGFSVMYTGFHFPLDVIGGVFLSTCVSLLLLRLGEVRVRKR